MKIDRLVAGAVKQRLPEALGQAAVRLGQVRPIMPSQIFQQPVVVSNHSRAALRPRQDDALLDRLFGVAEHQSLVEHRPLTQPRASRAGAVRRVEREMFRRHRVVAFAGGLAGQPIRQLALAPLRSIKVGRLVQRDYFTLTPLKTGFNRVSQAAARLIADNEPINHDLDRVRFLRIEFEAGVCLELRQLTVDARADKSLAGQLLQHVAKLALLFLHHRREQHYSRVLRKREQLLDDVARAQPRNRLATFWAMRLADVGKQQSQIIVNLGRSGDGRTRVPTGRTLLDGDRRREALDVIDVRLLKLIEELPGIRREGLDVLALALGEQRVKRQ